MRRLRRMRRRRRCTLWTSPDYDRASPERQWRSTWMVRRLRRPWRSAAVGQWRWYQPWRSSALERHCSRLHPPQWQVPLSPCGQADPRHGRRSSTNSESSLPAYARSCRRSLRALQPRERHLWRASERSSHWLHYATPFNARLSGNFPDLRENLRRQNFDSRGFQI